MKKVLMIAYQFPPMGGSGIQRTSKFVKYLGDFGWEPVILTRKTGKMQLKDESLCKDIPPKVKVYRTNPWSLLEAPGLLRLPGKLFYYKFIAPDGERLWQLFSNNLAEKIIEEEGIDLIYSTSYPFSDHLMGLHLKKKFPNIPWVADFRDEWTNNPYLMDKPHNVFRMNLEKDMERRVLAKADCLITNTPVMMANFIKNYPFTKDYFYTIPNGFDREDFPDMQHNTDYQQKESMHHDVSPNASPNASTNASSKNSENRKFTLTYTGTFYGRRKPDLFFEAIRKLKDSGQLCDEKLLIRLIGNFKKDQLTKVIKSFDLEKCVELLPYMEHKECVKKLIASDGLLLIEGAGPGAESFYTGKVFEYMNTGKPILAVIPVNGAAAQLIRKTETGFVSDCQDVENTMKNVMLLYKQWEDKEFNFKPNWNIINQFERRELTKELSNVFDRAIIRNGGY